MKAWAVSFILISTMDEISSALNSLFSPLYDTAKEAKLGSDAHEVCAEQPIYAAIGVKQAAGDRSKGHLQSLACQQRLA